MDPAAEATLVPGRGIPGNADQGGRRQVTIIAKEAWERATAPLGVVVDPSARRANLMVSGIPLQRTRGRILQVGPTRILVHGETTPCELMDEARIGLRAALEPNWNGGVFGEILVGGRIQIGDRVSWAGAVTLPGIVRRSEDEWRATLSPELFRVAREKGTEPPFSGAYVHFKEPGLYNCAACGNPLFSADAKFESGTGWPSFWAPFARSAVRTETDESHGMVRTEVRCSACGAHLGHVFPDGPEPTGLRYCINSVSLRHERDR
jgi:peptide-methionine (R)-S-oxide reductase